MTNILILIKYLVQFLYFSCIIPLFSMSLFLASALHEMCTALKAVRHDCVFCLFACVDLPRSGQSVDGECVHYQLLDVCIRCIFYILFLYIFLAG
jgi:hypothetical protein